MKRVVVIGANFAGSTAALEIKRRMKHNVEVTVIDPHENFLYFPSLIWVPIGRRRLDQVMVPRRPVFKKRGVNFILDTALSIDPKRQQVKTAHETFDYDELVIATGPKVNRDIAPGLHENAYYIGSIDGAREARERLSEFKHNPGPIVIGATQKASCMGAAYEFLFNVEKWLREQKIRKKADLYWITPEPFLGHFGIDGMPLGEFYLKKFMKQFNIHYRTEVGVEKVTKDSVVLSTGEAIPSRFTMLMVPFTGVDCIANSPELNTPDNHFIPTKASYQHENFDNVWGAGLAVDVKPPFTPGAIPFGSPKTGYPSDATGKIVASNVVKALKGRTDFKEKPWGKIPGVCVMDAGHKEILLLSNTLFKPRIFAIMIPNIFNDVTKVILEKYFLWKLRHGYSNLP